MRDDGSGGAEALSQPGEGQRDGEDQQHEGRPQILRVQQGEKQARYHDSKDGLQCATNQGFLADGGADGEDQQRGQRGDG